MRLDARRQWMSGVLAGVLGLLALPAAAQTTQPATAASKPAKAQPKIGVQFDFSRAISEQASDDDPFAILLSGGETVGLREWLRRLDRAATSEQVAAVLLMLDEPAVSWYQVVELRQAIARVRAAGKPVIAYSDDLTSASQYLLAAAADKVYISSGGGVYLNGMVSEGLYLKTMMDKIGVQADFIHLGAYKGAAEPLTQTGPSKEAAEMMNWLLDDLYALQCEEVGKSRGRDAAAGKAWIEGGPYTANQALAAKLVDGLKTRTEAIAEAKALAGLKPDEKLERRFAEKRPAEVDFGNPFAIFKLFAEASARKDGGTKPAIGLIYAEGMIVSGRSEEASLEGRTVGSLSLVSAVEKARRDEHIKAVVLRIDSPGGSATASDVMNAALVKLAAEKPLVVSVGSMAASGGYYIAAPAKRIFTNPNSLVGSIGVVGGKLVLKGLMDWAGVNTHRFVRGGPNAAILSSTTAFTEGERKWITGSMEEAFDLFKKAVLAGRGDKLKDFEAKIVGGKVFTGRQAVANGLADQLGTLEDALAYAADQAGLKKGDYEVRLVPKPRSFVERLVDEMSGRDLDEEVSAAPAPAVLSAAQASQVQAWLQQLAAVNRPLAEAVARQLRIVQMLGREHVLAVTPFELVIGR